MFTRSMMALFAAMAAALSLTAATQAGEDQPVRVDFIFRFNVRFGPTAVMPPDAPPWYMWWPADANETMRSYNFQSSPYPGWEAAQSSVYSGAGGGPIGYQPSTSPYRTVGFGSSVPNYWYGYGQR